MTARRWWWIAVLFASACVAAAADDAPAPTVERFDFWATPSRAFFVAYLNAPATLRYTAEQPAPGSNGGRLQVLLVGAHLGPRAACDAAGGPVESILVRDGDGGVELNLLAGAFTGYRVDLLPNPWRLVVEINARTAVESPAARRVGPIVLDPGHGGDELGACNGAVIEKDVVLDLARRVRRRLEAAGLRVLLTRDGDVYLPLDARYEFANDARAGAFVSLHVNASSVPTANGVEAYWYREADNGGLDATVTAENQAAPHESPVLPSIDPAERIMLQSDGERLARALQAVAFDGARARRAEADNRGVKAAPLFVLAGARMPAALLEIGFATHADEGPLLADETYREALAVAIAAGIAEFVGAPPAAEH